MSRRLLAALALAACAAGADAAATAPGGDAMDPSAAADFNRQGLVLWLDASQAGTVDRDAAGAVAAWHDRSGGRIAARGAGSPGPTLVEGGMNGLAVLRFAGGDWLEVPAIRAATGEVSVFVVAQRPAAAASDEGWQRWISGDGGGSNDDRAPGFALHDGEKGAALDPQILELQAGGVAIPRLVLGRNAHSTGNRLRGDIAEVLVFDRGFIAEGQIGAVRQYLARKWGARSAAAAKGWVRSGPLTDVPVRSTDAFPLSDQGNARGWVRYEAMCDEFAGDRLDAEKWWDHNPRWRGRQPALFLPKNVAVKDGELRLTMAPEPGGVDKDGYGGLSSAAVQSRTRVKYGYFETRAQPMRSHGSSAFWLYYHDGQEHTEIDIFEMGAGAPTFERYYHMGLHVFHAPGVKQHWGSGGIWTAPWDLADEFHVYGLDWNEKTITWFVDGVPVRKVDNSHWHQALTLDFDSEAMPSWFGLPAPAELPSTYRIDYCRVWRTAAMEPPVLGFTEQP